MDETRIEPALREGPPFRTRYVQRPLPLGSETEPGGSRLLALAAVTVLLVVLAIGGAALVGSGVVDPPVPPVLPGASPAPAPRGEWSWTATGSMITPFNGPTVLLADGRVLVAGGSDALGVSLASAEAYDPSTGSWTAVGSMTETRGGHTATVLPDGRVLLAGGEQCGETYWTSSPDCDQLASAELYDPRTGSWTPTGTMTERRAGHTATLLPDGTVLVSGGGSGNIGLASAELYDPRTGSWTPTGTMTGARAGHTATLLLDGTVLVAGGGSDSRTGLSSAELYDPGTGSWTATRSMRVAGGGRTATLLPDGTVLVVGSGGGTMFAFAELYDPGTGSWTTTGDMIEPRGYHSAIFLSNGLALVAGGANGNGDHHVTSTAELYDPETRIWTATGSLLGDRKFHSAVLLLDGTVLVMGGTDGPGGEGWHRLATAERYAPVSEE
jgi:N-acetylneuraminic acid mutarotase